MRRSTFAPRLPYGKLEIRESYNARMPNTRASAQGGARNRLNTSSCRMQRMLIAHALLLMLALAACARVETPKVTPIPVRLRVGADNATLPLMKALARAYQQDNPSWVITFETGSAAVVAGLAKDGAVDVAAVAQLPDDAEFKPWTMDLGVDGVAIIVNAANTVTGLSKNDVREIFAGFRNEWAFFGAPAAGSIQAVVREDGESTRKLFDRQIMGDTASTSSAILMPTPDTVINFVALNPGAIGYIPSGRLTSAPQPSIKILSLDGQLPSVDGLATGAYPLHRNLYLIARNEPRGKPRDFVAWLITDRARTIAAALGYATMR